MKKISSIFSMHLVKGAFVAACALFIQSAGYAQIGWTTSGSDIISPNPLGKVYIKNTSTAYNAYTSLRLQGPSASPGLEIGLFGNSNNQGGAWTYNAGTDAAYVANINNAPLVLATNNLGRIVIAANGNVGIGISNPLSKLHVSGTIQSDANKWFSGQDGGGNELFGVKRTDNGTEITTWSVGLSHLMLNPNGSVLIGQTTSRAVTGIYKLDVLGSIRANSIVVNTNGADFVFAKNYKLRPLSEVESFIKVNNHLPEIAPAAQMQKEGANVGELQTQLLQKIEELTLYMIEQNKKNEEQSKQLLEMKKENQLQTEQLQEIKSENKLLKKQITKVTNQ